MASYDDLESMIGPLKRAAIDAYVRTDGLDAGYWDINGDRYTNDGSSAGTWHVTRPNENGEGGGDWSWDGFWDVGNDGQDAKWKGAFDTIRTTIDDALKPWLYIPDPTEIAPLTESMRQANRTLKLSPGVVDGTAAGGGTTLAAALTGIRDNAGAMSGSTIESFKLTFLFQLASAIGGQHAISSVLGIVLAAEEGMWGDARQAVADLVKSSTDAFNAAAQDSSIDWDVALKVVGWAIKGVGFFATGGASTAVSVAGLGLEILTAGTEQARQAEKKGNDYQGLMDSFTGALTQLATDVRTEETTLQDNLKKNLTNVYADKSSFDLTPNAQDFTDANNGSVVVIQRDLVNGIIDTHMPAVSNELTTAETSTYDSMNIPAFGRSAELGVGNRGPMWEWAELMWILKDLLGDLSWETLHGAKLLDLAVTDLEDADAASQAALDGKRTELVGGSGRDPWDWED